MKHLLDIQSNLKKKNFMLMNTDITLCNVMSHIKELLLSTVFLDNFMIYF